LLCCMSYAVRAEMVCAGARRPKRRAIIAYQTLCWPR
jgi:hypothetical protein